MFDRVYDFLKDVMAYRHPRHSWSKERKFIFIQDLMSSSMWAEFDSTSRQTIINICSSLLKSWIKEINRLLNSTMPTPIMKYRSDVFTWVEMFFFVEKNRRETEQWIAIKDFNPVIKKVPESVPMDIVLTIDEEEYIKKSSHHFNWFRGLCRRLFKDVLPAASSKYVVATRILNLLLGLKDDQCWKAFEENLKKIFPAPATFAFLRIFLEKEKIQRGIADSPIALDCFDRIVNSWAMQSESRVEPVDIW